MSDALKTDTKNLEINEFGDSPNARGGAPVFSSANSSSSFCQLKINCFSIFIDSSRYTTSI
jgi:hypothetical protein